MKALILLAGLGVLATPVLAGPIAAGTEHRAWLAEGQTPVSGLPARTKGAVGEVPEGAAGLTLDKVTGVWGIPVPRLGDPDYGPDNPNYTGARPDTPLVLPAKVYAPDGKIDRARPCILIANGYGVDERAPENRGPDGSIFDELVPRGYTGVIVALRQSSSDAQARQIGVNGYYTHYGEDGVAIIQEMVRRFGCGMEKDDPRTAKVGMVGASLVGGSQWSVVSRSDYPAALKAIAPDAAGVTGMSYSTLWFPGGMLPGPLRITRPGRELGDVFPAHRDFDAYWQERQISSGQLQAAASRRLALLMTGGWDEYNTAGNLETYKSFRALSGPTNKRLVISPTGHTTPAWLYRPLVAEWMDQYLRGVAPPAEAPPVLLYIRGAERWRAEKSWPIADAKAVSLTLSPTRSGAIASRNDGSLGGPAGGPDATLAYDPDTGPFLHVMVSQSVTPPNTLRLTSDQTSDERKAATWTSRPLETATEITGNGVLEFWAASDIDDADFVAMLTMVAPDGGSKQIVQGYLNGPRQNYVRMDPAIEPPRPLTPGEPRRFTLRLLPTATVVPAGYRLRISIAGGADIGVGADGKPQRQPQGPGKNPRAFNLRILQDAAHPASLTLPIVGDVPAALAGRRPDRLAARAGLPDARGRPTVAPRPSKGGR